MSTAFDTSFPMLGSIRAACACGPVGRSTAPCFRVLTRCAPSPSRPPTRCGSGRPRARAARRRRRDRAHRGHGRVRLGSAHLPRPREDRAGLHDRPRVRRHGARRRRGRPRRRVGDRVLGLFPDRLRALLVLPPRPLPQVRSLRAPSATARCSARCRARRPSRRSCRCRPRAAPRARGHERRDGAIRGGRDGHRLPRHRRLRPAPWRHRRRAGPGSGGALRRAGRARLRRRSRGRRSTRCPSAWRWPSHSARTRCTWRRATRARRCARLTEGRGVDLCVDAVGHP